MGFTALGLRDVRFFFYGTLRHMPLLAAVLGRMPEARPARLAGHRVAFAEGQDFPTLLPFASAAAEGIVVEGISPEDRARLDFYEGGFAYAPIEMQVEVGAGHLPALVYFSEPGRWGAGEDWHFGDWQSGLGETAAAAADDVMALYGTKPAAAVAARRFAMLVRGASRIRAGADPSPAMLRRAAVPGDVDVAARREPYANFFAVEEYDLSFRRFDGGKSPVVNRAVFVGGDAVTVLPYDPVRDRVHLIEQFRPGPFARGDRQPWLLEAVAGRIDPGETADQAARREAVEEAGLHLLDLHPVAGYYPSPAAKTEFLYSFVAIADLPDEACTMGGMDVEAEDIRGHVIDFTAMMALVASGEIANAPLILTALWLQRERPRLRAAASA